MNTTSTALSMSIRTTSNGAIISAALKVGDGPTQQSTFTGPPRLALDEAFAWARALISPSNGHPDDEVRAAFEVSDDGRGRAMVSGRLLAYGGAVVSIGDPDPADPSRSIVAGVSVLAMLQSGVRYATLLQVLP